MRLERPDGDGNQVSWDEVWPHLYQGSRPLPGREVADMGMHVICMCINDWQLGLECFPGLVDCINCPLVDDEKNGMRPGDWERAWHAAEQVAEHVKAGRNVYVQCHAGQNRSGLVNGIVLTMLTGMSGSDAVKVIKAHRKEALWNTFTVAALETIKAK